MTALPGYGGPAGDPRFDARGRLVGDMPCRGCGYNLRGQAYNGTCPECGRAVEDSLVNDGLALADPIWVRRLATGVTLLLSTVLAAVVLMCGLSVGLPALMFSSGPGLFTPPAPVPAPAPTATSPPPASVPRPAVTPPPAVSPGTTNAPPPANRGSIQPILGPASTNTPPGTVTPAPAPAVAPMPMMPPSFARTMLIFSLLGVAGSAVVGGLLATGVWFITSPEPGVDAPQANQMRQGLRIGIIAVVMCNVGAGILQAAVNHSNMTGGPNIALIGGSSLAGLALSAAFVVLLICLAVYMRRLVARIPDDTLIKQTTIIIWGGGISSALILVGNLFSLIVMMSAGTGGPMGVGGQSFVTMIVSGGISCIGILGLLVFGIWGIVLLFMYRAAFINSEQRGLSLGTYA